jgi:hypothetical protein
VKNLLREQKRVYIHAPERGLKDGSGGSVRSSAFPTGLGGEGGDALFYLLALALRTGNLACFMLGNTQDQRKFLIAIPAFILVCRHFNPPFSRFALIGINRLLYLNDSGYIVKRGFGRGI